MTDESVKLEIEKLKRERNTVILVHNYQLPEIQDIGDFLGDSLELSRRAADTDADVIVFCGVHFMAETAAILSPNKTVLLPAKEAGCPMADMITARQLIELKQAHPKAVVVSYVNTSAEVKAESDYCCTSSNALAVVNSLTDAEEIIFTPDKHLGQYVSQQTGREMILWNGYCPTHERITEDDVLYQKSAHPHAVVMVHPECTDGVRKLADQVLSTGGMCKFAQTTDARELIVGTEIGIIHRLKKENPDKQFYPATERAVCPNMKRINLERLLWALDEMEHEIVIPPTTREKALRAVERMLEITAPTTAVKRD